MRAKEHADGAIGIFVNPHHSLDEVGPQPALQQLQPPTAPCDGVVVGNGSLFDHAQRLAPSLVAVGNERRALLFGLDRKCRVMLGHVMRLQPRIGGFDRLDAKLLNRAREKLVRLAQRHGVSLRQSYARVGKFALIQHQRYAHAKQFKRANRALKTLRTYLGRVIRDIGRKIDGNSGLEAAFAKLLPRARRVREQQQRQRGPKVYSLHAPEVECIGKGKAHRPYEFGVKVSVATTISRAKGGQFVTHVKALPGNPYDGHTLAAVIPDMEALVGSTIERFLADKGYRGHNAPPDHKFRVFISGQKRGVTPNIKRELRRRAAIKPVIGHLKAEHRMGRNYLWLRQGDAANAVLAAAGYNFRRLIRWLSLLLRQILTALTAALQTALA